RALRIEEREQIQRREIARRVVEESVFGAVVDDDAVGDEVMRIRFREIVDRFDAEVFETRHPVDEMVRIRGDLAIQLSQGGALRASRNESNLLFENDARAAANAKAVNLLDLVGFRSPLTVGQQ